MRAFAAVLPLATAMAACAPDETGLIVRAIPGEGVRSATRLEVYVGYEDYADERVQLPPIRRHDDDGRATVTASEIGEFAEPIDIVLTGHETRPMWIAVRAVDDYRMYGEGGFPRAVTKPTDELVRLDIVVAGGTIEGNRGCPGFLDESNIAHYIVPNPNTADCDRDEAPEGQDCDDFDRNVKPGAIDTICDGIDLDCDMFSSDIDAPCPVLNANGDCVIGTAVCNDERDVIDLCTPPPDAPAKVPPEVCASCIGLSGIDFIDCARPYAEEVSCEIEYTSTGFCQDIGTQLDALTWYEDRGPATQASGYALWTPGTIDVQYGWVENTDGALSYSGLISTAWPPSPSARIAGFPFRLDGRRDVQLVISRDPSAVDRLTIVELRYDREGDDTCDFDGPDCDVPFP